MRLDAIAKKIASIVEYVGILESLRENCSERMKSDKIYRGLEISWRMIMKSSIMKIFVKSC